MKVTVEELSSVKKVLHVEIPLEQVQAEIDSAYQGLKKTAKVKGFRPGKTPRSVLQRMYSKSVNADVAGRLIQESFVQALQDEALKMVGEPQIDPPQLEENAPYAYQATIEVNPEIADVEFKGLPIKRTLYGVQDEEIDVQLKMLQRNLAQLNPVSEERGLRQDDFALIDFEGFQDGSPVEALEKTENFSLKIGAGRLHEDFDAGLMGMAAGEAREIEVNFPEDFNDAKFAGQNITFKVKLQGIREEELPPIDDDMSKRLGPYDTLESLKDAIRNNLETGYEKRSEQEINEQIFSALIAQTEFEVPETLVNMELDAIVNDAQRSFEQNNVSMEDLGLTREGLMEKYHETAEKQVRRHLILGKIMDQEKLSLSDEEMEKGYADMAETFNQPVEGIKGYYKTNPDRLGAFKHTLLEKQAIKLIIDHGTIEEVEPEPAKSVE